MAFTTINDPSAHFQTTTYSGTGSSQSVTNTGNANLQPDWVWIKCRNVIRDHRVTDSTRGVTKELVPNSTAAEYTESAGLTAFNTDGFTVNGGNGYGASGENYVGWQWKANGGTTSTNNDGSQPTTIQVNSTAGFSIVKRTGTGSAGATYGHGLGAAPEVIISKGYNVNNWYSYFTAIGGGTKWLMIDGDGAAVTDANMWNDTNATSSVFTVGNSGGSNGSGVDYIAYCFKPIKGYSKFGLYTGNGSTDGTFVYTGFSPAWLMIKRTDSANSWYLIDNVRDPINVAKAELEANTTGVEATGTNRLDILSNGFKIRTSGAAYNASGGSYVYMAFAQNPFVATNNVAATAR